MNKILISGLVNAETTVRVRQFPINYYPIDYPFFGVNTAVSGVAYNIAKALKTLGDDVVLHSMTGSDFTADYIKNELSSAGIQAGNIKACLKETPSSVVLYEESGRRQIYCDLKDIQEAQYGFAPDCCDDVDLVVACNINFNRPLLPIARAAGKLIATDVHVFNNIYDEYNRDFLEYSDILFLSDESIGDDYGRFLWELAHVYNQKIIVLGRGSKGAAMYLRDFDEIFEQPAVRVGEVVNTVGAGDALFSAFLHYYAKGFDPFEALRRAQIFASAKIRVSGAAKGFISEEEVEAIRPWN